MPRVRTSLPVLILVLGTVSRLAAANPRPLPYTYPSESLTAGAFEIEEYVDTTPVPAVAVGTGAETTLLRNVLVTELEYGLTDRLELGLYFQFSNNPGLSTGTSPTVPVMFDGLKQRLRWSLAPPGEWPVDVSLYGEVAELQNEIELEAKVILQRRIGRVRVMVNLWAEHEFYFVGRNEWVLNPTAGLAWEIFPWLQLGLEYWMHAEYVVSGNNAATASADNSLAPFNQRAHHYVGPGVSMQFKKFWFSVAPYVRLDELNRKAQLGDMFGPLWVRSVIGIDF